jgi:predicted esterase
VTTPDTSTVHYLTVARTARYATTGADPVDAARLWVVFHGYGQTAADFVTPFESIVPADTRIVAPEGLSRFYVEAPRVDRGHLERVGATWLTRDDRAHDLRDALGMLHAVVAREVGAIIAARGVRPSIGVLGFSQGVAMSQRWVAVADATPSLGGRASIAQHVLWAGGLAHDVSDNAMRAAWADTAVQLVWGTRDAFATSDAIEAQYARVQQIASRVTRYTFDGGHRLERARLAECLAELPARQ